MRPLVCLCPRPHSSPSTDTADPELGLSWAHLKDGLQIPPASSPLAHRSAAPAPWPQPGRPRPDLRPPDRFRAPASSTELESRAADKLFFGNPAPIPRVRARPVEDRLSLPTTRHRDEGWAAPTRTYSLSYVSASETWARKWNCWKPSRQPTRGCLRSSSTSFGRSQSLVGLLGSPASLDNSQPVGGIEVEEKTQRPL